MCLTETETEMRTVRQTLIVDRRDRQRHKSNQSFPSSLKCQRQTERESDKQTERVKKKERKGERVQCTDKCATVVHSHMIYYSMYASVCICVLVEPIDELASIV